jgi:UDP-glucose 4-epimerase
MNVFVTGVGGFSGSHVARYLLRQGHRVTGLVRQHTLADCAADGSRLALVTGELQSLRELPPETDAVVHAAGTSAVHAATGVEPARDAATRNFIQDNACGTQNLAELASRRGVKRFIFFSSLSVYGKITQPVADESTPIVDPNGYGASKLLGELCLRDCAGDMASLALRLPAVVGCGASRHWLAAMLDRARSGAAMDIYNPDAEFNNAVHVEDLCVFIEHSLHGAWNGFDAVTLGAGGAMTIRQIVTRILEATRSSSRVIVHPIQRQSFTVSSRRAAEVHGYVPAEMPALLDRYLAEAQTGH